MRQNLRSRWAPTLLLVGLLLPGCTRDPVRETIQELRRGPVAQRQAAAQELGTLKDPRAVGPLSAALQDQDEAVANAAAVALGRIGDPRAVGSLAAALRRPATCWSAAEALVGLGEPAFPAVLAALSNEDPEIGKALLSHLKQHEVKERRLVEPLLRLLRSSDALVRQAAVELLGQLRAAQALEGLTQALQDDNRLVREAAAGVLGEMGDARAVDALLGALRDLKTAEAARALGRLGAVRALEPLAAVFRGAETGMRSPAAEGLGLMGTPRALEVLLGEILNWDLRTAVGDGLAAARWKPATPRAQVYLWICESNAAALAQARAQTCAVLFEDVRSKDKVRIDHAVFALLSLGWADLVPELERILEEEGDEKLAETYLNCGHDDLRAAALTWGEQHGYTIAPVGGSRQTSWGAWQ